MYVENTLAYYKTTTITAVKCFIVPPVEFHGGKRFVGAATFSVSTFSIRALSVIAYHHRHWS
jgi:hypothetical protein